MQNSGVRMASLSQVIKVRSLLDSFNDIEFNELIARFVKQCGREALLTPFFAQHMKQNKSYHNPNSQHIINIIVRKRKSNFHLFTKVSIHTLPKAIIGEVASYLSQKDYVSLTKTNRSIYIGCNEPNTLRHLDLKSVNNYSCIDLQKYPQLTHLEIDLTKPNQLSLPSDKTILHHLNRLTLYANDQRDVDINALISQLAINLSNINHLKLTRFATDDQNDTNNWFSKATVLQLLEKFANTEYLNMDNVWPLIYSEDSLNLPMAQNLKAIRAIRYNLNLVNYLIETCGPSLQSLHLGDYNTIELPSHISFPKLTEFFLLAPTSDNLNILSKKAELIDISASITNESQMRETLQKIITTYSELEVLFIHDVRYDYFDCICDGIEKGLSLSHEKKGNLRMLMQFGDELHPISPPESSDSLIKIARILNQLQLTKLDNFMLHIALIGEVSIEEEWNKHKELFGDCNINRLKIGTDCDGWFLTISNKGCKISGMLNGAFMFNTVE